MNFFLVVCILAFSFFSCLKIQKKSDLNTEPSPVSEQTQEEAEPFLPIVHRFSGVINLTQDYEINADEVYFDAGTQVYTNQFSLKINATNLYFDHEVVIQTFSETNKVAQLEQNGLSGGLVEIKALTAKGNLLVRMNGQSGGPGRGGWNEFIPMSTYGVDATRTACNPNSGMNAGRAGSFYLTLNSSPEFYISTIMEIGKGGAIGDIYDKPKYLLFEPDYKTKYKGPRDNCIAKPYVGENGPLGQICMKLDSTKSPVCEKYQTIYETRRD